MTKYKKTNYNQSAAQSQNLVSQKINNPLVWVGIVGGLIALVFNLTLNIYMNDKTKIYKKLDTHDDKFIALSSSLIEHQKIAIEMSANISNQNINSELLKSLVKENKVNIKNNYKTIIENTQNRYDSKLAKEDKQEIKSLINERIDLMGQRILDTTSSQNKKINELENKVINLISKKR